MLSSAHTDVDSTRPLGALLDAALELTRGLSAEDCYDRILQALVGAIPCDAATLLRVREDGILQPLAVCGMSADILGRHFTLGSEPRLAAIVRSRDPTFFAADDPMPDPFDGYVLGSQHQQLLVHSCMGSPLWVGDELVGALTLDALEPGQFDSVDGQLFGAFAALCAAAVQTAELITSLERRAEHHTEVARQLVDEALRREGGELLGRSESMVALRREIDTVASTDLTVLVTGETGTGKELVARKLHAHSRRADHPLVYVNCAALPESLAESELFGHARGAFTGAVSNRAGKFELADGGTLFLDEVGELPLAIQAKMLRALQFGEVQRVGSERDLVVDVRVIAATNRDLRVEVEAGRFRSDLYHRLQMYPVHVAPLREREDDTALLAGHFLDRARLRLGTPSIKLSAAALSMLQRYDWPGNARELDHVVTRAALRTFAATPEGPLWITPDMLDVESSPRSRSLELKASSAAAPSLGSMTMNEALDNYKATLIQEALTNAAGNWSAAARRLGVDRGNLHRMAQRLGLK